jgi:hypothetical protein
MIKEKEVPEWIRKRWKWDKKLYTLEFSPNKCVELKGRHYRYRICSTPANVQGYTEIVYYRKLRSRYRHQKSLISKFENFFPSIGRRKDQDF